MTDNAEKPINTEPPAGDSSQTALVVETKTTTSPIVSSKPTWPELAPDHPLRKFSENLEELIKEAGYDEVYGITLGAAPAGTRPDFHTLLILQKFLRANQGDVTKAKEQLLRTLIWRKEFQPQRAVTEIFSREKFAGLGYITTQANDTTALAPQVITWNIYGAVKDYEKTFVPVEEFLRWRIALMELGVSKLHLSTASQPIPDHGNGADPYQGVQVHDYKNVSFLRMDPRAKAASKQTIQILGDHYPETLHRKFFVNVPWVMQWMFAAMKLVVSAETTKKFAVLSDGAYVSGELGKSVPKEYGGELGPLSEVSESLKLDK